VTVARKDLAKALQAASDLAKALDCPPPTHCEKVAKLSVFGVGIKSHTGVAARMFQALAHAGINVELISTSEVRVNVVVNGRDGHKSLTALKKELADALA
jgi:aspartate kinase